MIIKNNLYLQVYNKRFGLVILSVVEPPKHVGILPHCDIIPFLSLTGGSTSNNKTNLTNNLSQIVLVELLELML